MFNVGGGELLVILLLGLLILGPERLPKAMGQVGRWVAQLRKLSTGFQDEIRRAMDPDDVPFRPGEQTLRPAVDEEVRVVGADPPDEDGIIDTSADEHDPSHTPVDDEVPDPATPSDDATTDPPAPAEGAAPGEGGTVTPLHGRDDGDARAAG